ncbi:MAG: flavin reductase family protein [bacterium]
MIYPLPAVLVSCGKSLTEANIITIAWTGTICSNPPMCYISVRPERYSYDIIKETGEYVINLSTSRMSRAVDWCGVKSGRDFNKFKEMKLTPVKASKITAPLIDESPLNIECKVTKIISLGTHDMFLSQVVAINADRQYVSKSSNAFNMSKAGLLAFSHGRYYAVGKELGRFGFSVRKRKKNYH